MQHVSFTLQLTHWDLAQKTDWGRQGYNDQPPELQSTFNSSIDISDFLLNVVLEFHR